ncbi:MAG: LVIVD repeat-containing protein, partial [Anaerolineae bacterium]
MSVRSAGAGLRPVAALAGATMALVLVPASSPSTTLAGAAGPQVVPAVDFDAAGFVGGAITGVAVAGDYAYVSRGLRLEVFDVSDPASPRLVGGSGLLPGMAKATVSRHGVVYLVERVRGAAVDELDRLIVVDASVPSAPELRGSLEMPKGTLADIAVGAGFLYTAAEGLGVMVLDISDPERPHVVGAVAFDERVNGVAVADAGLLVAVGGTHDGGLRVLSLDDPMRPQPMGSLEVANGGGRTVAGVGDFALLATRDRVVVVDVGDPTAPRAQAQVPRVYNARAIAVEGRRAFVLGAPAAVRDTHHLTA